MKSNYKRLGNYIHKVEKRNTDLKVAKLRGLSMTKEFRKTTSNIIGTDMTVYKVMSKWQNYKLDRINDLLLSKLATVEDDI
jgi:type I restriction enzyme S subunit